MDFIMGLPKVHRRYFLYMVVDQLTKISHFFAISLDYSTSQVADLFFKKFLDSIDYLKLL